MTQPESTNSLLFAKKILELTEANWVEPSSFDVFVQMAHISPGKQKVDFCQRFLALIKRLPDKLVEPERRQKIVDAGQEYLEQAIQEEDELESQNPS